MNANAAPAVVLVADDEPTMLELVARHLRSIEQPKLEVIEASDGDEAWQLARERLPDLVVLDVMMPGMSGWEVCRKIRQDAGLAHTGVLMLTGIGESLNEATSPLFGADEYIDKPFEFDRLDEKIRNVLARRSAQREAVPRPRGAEASGGAPNSNGLGGAHHAESSEPAVEAAPSRPKARAKRNESAKARATGNESAKVRATGNESAKARANAKARAKAGASAGALASAKKKPRATPQRKRTRAATSKKGKKNMAAKKGAKKAAKKGAKKGAKKAKKGAKKGR